MRAFRTSAEKCSKDINIECDNFRVSPAKFIKSSRLGGCGISATQVVVDGLSLQFHLADRVVDILDAPKRFVVASVLSGPRTTVRRFFSGAARFKCG